MKSFQQFLSEAPRTSRAVEQARRLGFVSDGHGNWYSKGKATINDASWAGIAIDFPRIQGIDVCGNIVAVGKNVSKNRIGERVLVEPCLREIKGKALSKPFFLGSECDGGFAEFVVI